MSLRGLLALVVLLAAVVVALVYLRGPDEDTKAPDVEAPIVAAFEDAKVRSISTTCDDVSYVLRRNPAGGWDVTSPITAEADPREVTTLLDALRGARSRRTIAGREADASSFGLDPESCSIRLELDGDAAGRRLVLGRTSPVGYERYARGADGSVVFVDGSLHGAIARPPDAWRERRLLPVDPGGVKRLAIERPDGRIVLVRGDGGWRLEEPVQDAADRQESDRALEAATSLEIESGGTPARPLQAARERTIALSVDGRTAYVAAAGVEGKRLAWRRGSSEAGLVRETALEDLDRPAGAFRDRQVLSFSSPDARRVVVTRGEVALTFTRASEADPWTGQEAGDVNALLDRLRNVRALSVEDGKPPTPPTGTLVVSGEKGELARATWGPLPPRASDESVWVETPGRAGVHFRVLASAFGPMPTGPKAPAAP